MSKSVMNTKLCILFYQNIGFHRGIAETHETFQIDAISKQSTFSCQTADARSIMSKD